MLRRAALIGLLLLLYGCASPIAPPVGPGSPPLEPPAQAPGPPPAQPLPPLPTPERPPRPVESIPPGSADHLLGAGLKLRVLAAQGAMPDVRRSVQLLRLERGRWRLVNAVSLPHLPGATVRVSTEALPGYPEAIVIEASRGTGVRHGAVAVVNGRLVALDLHRLAAPVPEVKEGVFLFLNKYMNQLWVFRDGQLIATFPTANGRDPWGSQPTWQDYKSNYKTPEGLFEIRQKIVNPPYNGLGGNHPPVAGGALNNPLGTRWIGFEALPGDGGGIWGFHGTYVPEQIGTWASEGCVRLNTADAEQLYDLVPLGAQVRIISGR